MPIRPIPPGTRGFDCNVPISATHAQRFANAGYRFVLRYVPRIAQSAHDLTELEVSHLLLSGLAVMPVQHVESDGWTPSAEKGTRYGLTAAESAEKCVIARGTSVWLDLEGVSPETDKEEVIAYCNAWYDQVRMAGFLPGIYVGWRSLLSPDDLYRRLKFQRYWSAYNLNSDQFPAVCGVCMRQHESKDSDYPDGFESFAIDQDVVTGDSLDRLPVALAPDTWDPAPAGVAL